MRWPVHLHCGCPPVSVIDDPTTAVDDHLQWLDEAVAAAFAEVSPERSVAAVADRTGIGLGRLG